MSVKRIAAPLAASVALAFAAGTADAAAPPLYKNCTNLNKRYPHGVGRFRRERQDLRRAGEELLPRTRLYLVAMRWNKGLDRDKDGIACEKT